MKHPTTLDGMDMQELAERVENLRYDALTDFLDSLQHQLAWRAYDDADKDRVVLAEALREVVDTLGVAATQMSEVWSICEPYMEEE